MIEVMEQVALKRCTKCCEEKPAIIEYFTSDSRGKYGLASRCKVCANKYSRLHRLKSLEKINEYRRSYRVKNRDRLNEHAREYRVDRHQEDTEYRVKKWYSDRIKCIKYYGGCCAVCGESRVEFLVIDHINNDGNTDRAGRGDKVCRRLIKNKFPPGFQVLCWNHNHLKRLEFNKSKWLNTSSSIRKMKSHRKCRNAVISRYGGKCVVCGESDVDLLTIDHINGGGNKHRSEISDIYRWLKLNDFPLGFQVLCHNCNCGKIVNSNIIREILCQG